MSPGRDHPRTYLPNTSINTRVAAILLEIDANELNNVFAVPDFIILKIGDFLGNEEACSEPLRTLSRCSISRSVS